MKANNDKARAGNKTRPTSLERETMVKECIVLFRNAINMVVDFEGSQIQMPTDNSKSNTVLIKFENNKYSIASHEDVFVEPIEIIKEESHDESDE